MKEIAGIKIPNKYADRIAEIKPLKSWGRGIYEVTLKPMYVWGKSLNDYYFLGVCNKEHLVQMLSETFIISDSEYSLVRLRHGYGMGF